MARVTVEDCLENVESRFGLVHLAVRRVLQLRRGAAPVIEAPKNKEIVVALREIAAKSVTTENIRQFEELEVLPEKPSVEAEGAIRKEVEELMEAETQHSVALEFSEMKEEVSEIQAEGGEDTEEPT